MGLIRDFPEDEPDTPESRVRADVQRCMIVHSLYPRMNFVCGRQGDMPCVTEVVDRADALTLALRGAFDTPAEQA